MQTQSQTVELNSARMPVVRIDGGEAMTSSRDVAAFFGKDHRNILRDIDNLIAAEPDLALRNFEQGVYTLPETHSQEHRCFDMNRDGFTLLAMGFTGGKALRFKLAYIAQFNAMESELRRRSPASIDFSDPVVLLGAFQHLQNTVAEKDKVIEAQGEKVQALRRIEAAHGSMCITDAAKTLNVRRNDLIAFMQARRWIYKRVGNSSWLAYDDKRHAGYMEHDDHMYKDEQDRERVATRALVTAKGLVKLAELLNERLH